VIEHLEFDLSSEHGSVYKVEAETRVVLCMLGLAKSNVRPALLSDYRIVCNTKS
jgi:hypothetical protein